MCVEVTGDSIAPPAADRKEVQDTFEVLNVCYNYSVCGGTQILLIYPSNKLNEFGHELGLTGGRVSASGRKLAARWS